MNVEAAKLRAAGEQRLKEFEQLADEIMSEPPLEEAADNAAKAHLAEHARLAGMAASEAAPSA